MISAKIICDSIANGVRITTMELHAPKMLDAQFEKHRMFSSNSSSDRAVPLEKLISNGCHLPQDIRLDEPGMQGKLSLDEEKVKAFHEDLLGLFENTNNVLRKWKVLHKQHINRYLLGFSWQRKLVTATEWQNFFDLRLHPDAQPEMYELAKCMKEAMDGSTPNILYPGQWHLPYYYGSCTNAEGEPELDVAIKCSVARCARVSFLNHDNSYPNVEKDVALADRLLSSGHMSPFEHQATPMKFNRIWDNKIGVTHIDKYDNLWSGNFRGWIQNRSLL